MHFLKSPTLSKPEDTHFIHILEWRKYLRQIENASVFNTSSSMWGEVSVIECTMHGTPMVFALIRKFNGKPLGHGFAWQRGRLQAELKTLEKPKDLAHAVLFFGDFITDLL
ncbi:hypothetical protein AA106555_1879 [Neokomagataea thailandica NBRC 106555]|uniref:Uncharacterized protein n=2 Tax=Neokomagataea TaxID=1223423 RepID=A0A4Y6V3B7_9PROT|nr:MULTISPECIES: hypothetical protein [Neokomagataea]QDH24592.1 hypothetical protein D5366_04325 [Neokomagataea tanensis]GBR54959.1 hypothetical protein AA106555_1879 [Neokomagataea thailandica NBRC 106555]